MCLLEVIVVRKRNAVHIEIRRFLAKVGRNGARIFIGSVTHCRTVAVYKLLPWIEVIY
jgi:hypothetical protein